MTDPIRTYRAIDRLRDFPIIDVLIEAYQQEIALRDALLRTKERDLQQMFCAFFDIWWSGL